MKVMARESLSFLVVSLVLGLAGCEHETPTARPATVALVLEGNAAIWGNDQYERRSDCSTADAVASGAPCRIVKVSAGIVGDVGAAVPTVAADAPPGEDAVVIVYDEQPVVRYEGRLSSLTAASLGSQLDQRGRTGRDLARALDAAFDRLEQGSGPRRLVAVTDGHTAAPDLTTSARLLEALAVRARGANIEVTLLLLDYFPVPSSTPDGWSAHQRALASLGRVVRITDPARLRTELPTAIRP